MKSLFLRRDERGMIGLAPAMITLAVLLLAAVTRLGSGVVAQARADAAARIALRPSKRSTDLEPALGDTSHS